ncbi:hypothetical protein [Burkholderia gladioli]|uniref:hypothetical protein n=1 Tax=Burkholderia gladioli TaxID=28095 RepID=UPI001640AC3E|nr:hypothetical protein [Burkholderia gladioli]
MPGIQNVPGTITRNLQAFFLDGRYTVLDSPTHDGLLLRPHHYDELTAAFGCDCSRMACASFETCTTSEQSSKLVQSSGWTAIRYYYAAFFACHALMRVYGISCTNVESKHIKALREAAQTSGFGGPGEPFPGSGLFSCMWDSTANVLRVSNLSNAKGGTHEVTWKLFSQLLMDLSDKLLSNNAVGRKIDLQQCATRLDTLRGALSVLGCNGGNWLSVVRNKANYSHEYGLWFPYGKARTFYAKVHQIAADSWLAEADQCPSVVSVAGSEVETAVGLSGNLVALCRETMMELEKYSGEKNSFARASPLRLLRVVDELQV